MILIDASIWIDHFRAASPEVSGLLSSELVCMHPMVEGELACGDLADPVETLGLLERLPRSFVASHGEVMAFIESGRLMRRGLGYIDVHLLAATAITPETRLWTRDRRLREAAEQLGLAYAT